MSSNITHVAQVETELIAAMKSSDVEALDRLIHDDLIFSVPSGKSVNKEMDLAAYASGKMNVEVLDVIESDFVDFDGCVAVSVIVQLEGTYGDDAFRGRFRFLRVWKEFAGQWKVITGGSHALKD